jgi:hypothetical protein
MTLLERIQLTRADEQTRAVRSLREPVARIGKCQWLEEPCSALIVRWNKTGLCTMHSRLQTDRLRKCR